MCVCGCILVMPQILSYDDIRLKDERLHERTWVNYDDVVPQFFETK